MGRGYHYSNQRKQPKEEILGFKEWKKRWIDRGRKKLFYELREEVNKLRDQPDTGIELELQIKNRLLGKIGVEEIDKGITPNNSGSMQQMETTKPFRSEYLHKKMMCAQ